MHMYVKFRICSIFRACGLDINQAFCCLHKICSRRIVNYIYFAYLCSHNDERRKEYDIRIWYAYQRQFGVTGDAEPKSAGHPQSAQSLCN